MLGLQAANADGSETTFDGQPMQVGTHLRSASRPSRIPPGGFWLWRRPLSKTRCGPAVPPVAVSRAITNQRREDKEDIAGANGGAAPTATASGPQGLASGLSLAQRWCGGSRALRRVLLLSRLGRRDESSRGQDRRRDVRHCESGLRRQPRPIRERCRSPVAL